MKRFIITQSINGLLEAEYADTFNINDLQSGMVVYDLIEGKYLVNSLGWINIKQN